jgi:hypothetical protein
MRFSITFVPVWLSLLLILSLRSSPSFAMTLNNDTSTDDGPYSNCSRNNDVAISIQDTQKMELYITSLTTENEIEEAENCVSLCENIDRYGKEIIDDENSNERSTTIVDWLMNFNLFDRLMNVIHHKKNDSDQRYMVPTKIVLQLLSKYSTKLKSLATMLRNETIHNTAMDNTTLDVISLLFELSAENMESVTTVLDPFLHELSQYETMNVSTISCSLLHLTSYIQDETFPNIVSILEILVSMSNNTQMKDSYTQYITTNFTTIFKRVNHNDVTKQCLNPNNSTSTISNSMKVEQSGKSLKERIIDIKTSNVSHSISNEAINTLPTIINVITSIILLPAIIVRVILGSIVLAIFSVVLFLYELFPNFVACNIGIILIIIFFPIFTILFFPLLIISVIFGAILQVIVFLLDILSNNPPLISITNDVMFRLSMVLESPIEQMIDMVRHVDTLSTNDEIELDCEIKTFSCKNNALVNALPF